MRCDHEWSPFPVSIQGQLLRFCARCRSSRPEPVEKPRVVVQRAGDLLVSHPGGAARKPLAKLREPGDSRG